MTCFGYRIVRDYGFAPNPFGGYCTLACCKPKIRCKAKIGDWVLGSGSKRLGNEGKVIFVMKVTEKLHTKEYWDDPRFQLKKPNLNGSLLQIHGDNIYRYDEESEIWIQSDSHHSLTNGGQNIQNIERDTSCTSILISDHFYFFGDKAPLIPNQFSSLIPLKQGHKSTCEIPIICSFVSWIESTFKRGIYGDPINWPEYSQFNLF